MNEKFKSYAIAYLIFWLIAVALGSYFILGLIAFCYLFGKFGPAVFFLFTISFPLTLLIKKW